MKPIVFDVPLSSGIRNQIATARLLREKGAEVIFFFGHPRDKKPVGSPDFSLDEFKLVFADDCAPEQGFDLPQGSDQDAGSEVAGRLPSRSQKVFVALRQTYEATMRRTAAFLASVRPAAVVLSDDGVACNSILTSVAKAYDIPILCCPYGNGTYEDLESTVGLGAANGQGFNSTSPGGDIVAERFPKWLKTGKHAGSLLQRPEVILAKESVGATIERPWHVYGSEATIFCAPSVQYQTSLIASGFDSKRSRVTGSANGALIHRVVERDAAVRAAFRAPRKLDPSKTRVLVAFPPSYHATRSQFARASDSYTGLLDHVTRPLRDRANVELTVSMHPATAAIDRQAYHELGIVPDDNYLLEQIPQHDIFITDFSSTIPWAIACGKPVLNYDFYGFALTYLADVPGVVTISDPAEYLGTLEALTETDDAFARLATRQIEIAENWGRIDRHFADELLSIIH